MKSMRSIKTSQVGAGFFLLRFYRYLGSRWHWHCGHNPHGVRLACVGFGAFAT
jgi:hypothetical protein